jgi:hypothetical protein
LGIVHLTRHSVVVRWLQPGQESLDTLVPVSRFRSDKHRVDSEEVRQAVPATIPLLADPRLRHGKKLSHFTIVEKSGNRLGLKISVRHIRLLRIAFARISGPTRSRVSKGHMNWRDAIT